MKKKYKKSKIWNNLKSGFKWLLIIILILWLLSFLENFLNHYNLLIEKIQQQGQNIDSLNDKVSNLINSNNLLANQVQLDHSQFENIQHKLSIKINGQEISSTPKIHSNILNLPNIPMVLMIPVTIMVTLTSIKSLLFNLSF